jgi:hypothetical protein
MPRLKEPKTKNIGTAHRLQYAETHGISVTLDHVVHALSRMSDDKRLCIMIWDYTEKRYTWIFREAKNADLVRLLVEDQKNSPYPPRFWEITFQQQLDLERMS